MDNPNQITYFAETDARNRRVTFGIKAEDRTKHVYVIGKTGMGKSTLLENMAAQDIRNGNGFAFMDPHGSAIDTLIQYIPKERIQDVIYFAPFDIEYPISFNVMEDVGYDKRHLVVSGLMSTFKKIWQDAWSARMEYILGNTLLALLEYPNATLLEVNKMLSDKEFRKKVVENVTDPAVKSFWVDEFAKYTDRFAAEATPAIQNKIGQFTSNPLVRNIIGQPQSSFDMREVMDQRKILLVNLSKGRIGESNANLLGSMLITKMYLSALSRADAGKEDMKGLPNFYVYVDEFQSFANDSFADILSEARKYKLNLTIAHQYIEQMSDEVRAAVFGNVGTMISFRVGSYDAEVLEKEFAPVFLAEDIVNLGFAQVYLRLMIDGIGSQPFSAKTLAPLQIPEISYEEEILGHSRQSYTRPRAEVEEFVKNLHSHNNKSSAANDRDKGGSRENINGDSNGGNGHKNKKFEKGGVGNISRGAQPNSNKDDQGGSRPKTRPAISKNLRQELEKQLEEKKRAQIEIIERKSNQEDLGKISLRDMTMNTRSGSNIGRSSNPTEFPSSGKNNVKNKSVQNKKDELANKDKSSLKKALAEILDNSKRDESKKNNKTRSNQELVKKSNSKKENLDLHEPKSKNTADQNKEEIPESELRRILEI